MSLNKNREIAGVLRRKIAEGVYQGKLPPVRDLIREFGVSSHTMSKALKILSGECLIASHGSQGTQILKSNISHTGKKIVGIVYPKGPNSIEQDPLLGPLRKYFRESSCTPFFIKYTDEHIRTMDFWNSVITDGIIFCYSTFNLKAAQCLEKRGITVTAGNRLPEGCGFSWVDFDHEKHFSQIVEWLSERNVRRIVMSWPTGSSGMKHPWGTDIWKRILRKYDLEPYEDIFLDYGVSLESLRLQAEMIAKLKPVPEAVVICCHPPGNILEEFLLRSGLRLPVLSYPIQAWSNRKGNLEEAYHLLADALWKIQLRRWEQPAELHQVHCFYANVMGTVLMNSPCRKLDTSAAGRDTLHGRLRL